MQLTAINNKTRREAKFTEEQWANMDVKLRRRFTIIRKESAATFPELNQKPLEQATQNESAKPRARRKKSK